MSKTGKVCYGSILAGFIIEYDAGYKFVYHRDYLANESAKPQNKKPALLAGFNLFGQRKRDSPGPVTVKIILAKNTAIDLIRKKPSDLSSEGF